MKLLIKIFSPLLLIISLLIFIYIFYRSEIIWNGERHDYFLIYYLASSLLIVFSFLSFYFKTKIKTYSIIILSSFVISVYSFESYLYFSFNEAAKYNLYNKLKKDIKNVSVRHSPFKWLNSQSTTIPISGKSFSKTIDCNENGYLSINEHDRYGFNNPDSEWDAENLEYLILGDSFAYGSCVNRPNDIASQLRILSNSSVITLGYPANGPLLEYASLREYFSPNIKNVLWVYLEDNDLYGLNVEIKNKVLRNYIENIEFSQNLRSKQKLIDEFTLRGNKYKSKQYSIKNKILRYVTLVLTRQTVRSAYKKNKHITSVENNKNFENFKKIIQQANSLIQENNSKLFFIYLPSWYRFTTDFDDFEYKSVKKIIDEIDIPFIDIYSEVFKKEVDPLNLYPFRKNAHYTAEGYKKISETIIKFTKN